MAARSDFLDHVRLTLLLDKFNFLPVIIVMSLKHTHNPSSGGVCSVIPTSPWILLNLGTIIRFDCQLGELFLRRRGVFFGYGRWHRLCCLFFRLRKHMLRDWILFSKHSSLWFLSLNHSWLRWLNNRAWTEVLSYRRLLGDSRYFDWWVLGPTRYLIRWLSFLKSTWLCILYRLSFPHDLCESTTLNSRFLYLHGPLPDNLSIHRLCLCTPYCFLLISNLFPLPFDFFPLCSYLLPRLLLSLLDLPHHLTHGLPFFRQLSHCLMKQPALIDTFCLCLLQLNLCFHLLH